MTFELGTWKLELCTRRSEKRKSHRKKHGCLWKHVLWVSVRRLIDLERYRQGPNTDCLPGLNKYGLFAKCREPFYKPWDQISVSYRSAFQWNSIVQWKREAAEPVRNHDTLVCLVCQIWRWQEVQENQGWFQMLHLSWVGKMSYRAPVTNSHQEKVLWGMKAN